MEGLVTFLHKAYTDNVNALQNTRRKARKVRGMIVPGAGAPAGSGNGISKGRKVWQV